MDGTNDYKVITSAAGKQAYADAIVEAVNDDNKKVDNIVSIIIKVLKKLAELFLNKFKTKENKI